jgi:hypothetical protein
MSLNNVLSLNGVIKKNNVANVNSNVFSNPYSSAIQTDYYATQHNIDTSKYNLNSINIEKSSLELSLNILGLEHSKFESMTKHEFIYYYDNFKKHNTNINKIIASKIALKQKLGSNNDMNYSGTNVLNHSYTENTEKNNNFYQPEIYNQQTNNLYSPNNPNTYGLNSNQKQNQQQQNQQQQNQQQNFLNNYGTESTVSEYSRTDNNTNIQKAKQSINTSSFSVPNQNNKIQQITKPQNQVDSRTDFMEQHNFKPNFKPVQMNTQESNPNKYLSTTPTPAPILVDKQSRDFDLSSIIDNYSKQKNSGITGKNLDVSFNIPTNR